MSSHRCTDRRESAAISTLSKPLLSQTASSSTNTAPNEMRAVMSISTAPCIHRGMGTEYREKGEKLFIILQSCHES